jgi:hypothetical protein
MTSLDISSNSIGICDDLPEGWTYDSNYSMCYRHTDGNQSSPPSGAKSSGVIAIANAIGDMGALASMDLRWNNIPCKQEATIKAICNDKNTTLQL